MSILDNILGALGGQSGDAAGHPLQAALSGLLQQNGGVQGLMEKFTQGGLGDVFSSWVGMGPNQGISADQISNLLGSEQIQGLAASLGIDPSKASGFLADYLPKIIDKLTPSGNAGGAADAQQGISDLMPSLLEKFNIG
jgi:uncharacterized protein YidB (DUF937 family)